ncbi:hypothetical protein PEC302107_40300 [Pectobacterium araliae]|nr:hypothetical protein PEC302107_40300 [Pectobacterium carotovorum subsp. carotovorum]
MNAKINQRANHTNPMFSKNKDDAKKTKLIMTCRSVAVIYYLIISHQIQPTGKVIEPVGDHVLIERREAQGLPVAPQFSDILRGDDNVVGHDA